MTRPETCIPRILEHEGGYVDHPRDPGGATNKGVTIATFRAYVKPNGTVDDLRKLTTEQATIVYKRQYWDKVSADLLPIGVDYAVADFAVNSGPNRAARYLQRALGVPQDGIVGPRTIAAARNAAPDRLINAICDSRLKFLRGLETWSTFGRGWSSRVEGVRSTALADTAQQHIPRIPADDHPREPSKPVGIYVAALAALAIIIVAIIAA